MILGWSALVTCEHARGEVPPGIELGLSEATRRSHVSMDAGAEQIARAIAARLDAPLHHGRFSRLVVDLNRRAHHPDVIREQTYGVVVPGNVGLSAEARQARIERYHRPYRESARADAVRLSKRGCLHLSIHSFDPALDPAARAFDVGVLFDTRREPEASVGSAILDGLRERGLDARANDPYAGVPEGLTSWLRDALPASRYIGLEIEAQQARFATRAHREGLAAHLVQVVSSLTGS